MSLVEAIIAFESTAGNAKCIEMKSDRWVHRQIVYFLHNMHANILILQSTPAVQ